MKTDTIAAIATAMSPSGIGIIRISGEDAIEITDKIYRSKNNKKKAMNNSLMEGISRSLRNILNEDNKGMHMD